MLGKKTRQIKPNNPFFRKKMRSLDLTSSFILQYEIRNIKVFPLFFYNFFCETMHFRITAYSNFAFAKPLRFYYSKNHKVQENWWKILPINQQSWDHSSISNRVTDLRRQCLILHHSSSRKLKLLLENSY